MPEVPNELLAGMRVKIEKTYPLIDSDTNLAIPNLEGIYFTAEIDYKIGIGKKRVVPISRFMQARTFFLPLEMNYWLMSEELAKVWINRALGNKPIILQLEELILGDEGDQEIHTLKAKGRVYCRT